MIQHNIGGFFQIELAPAQPGKNLFNQWSVTQLNHICLHNARSCLHYLLQAQHVQRIWLPAYICVDMVTALENTQASLHFYPVSDDLSPRVDFLYQYVQAGDFVLAVDYFGRNPTADFLQFIQSRADVQWIEDRAQALWPADEAWGDWIIYSPRKLLGVPDGGILVSRHNIPKLPIGALTNIDFMLPCLWRYEDTTERNNQAWYAKYVEAEKNMPVAIKAMSRITQYILSHVDVNMLMQKRIANYKYLASTLQDIAFYQDELDFVPMGFPIQLKQRDSIFNELITNKIFAQRHWINLPAPAEQFLLEHKLSRELLTLPCDHRYNLEDMDYIIKTLKKFL